MGDCLARPVYRQNDSLGWINRAIRPALKAQRFRQVLDELEAGDIDIKMAHPPSAKR